jgi:hypothetical protein
MAAPPAAAGDVELVELPHAPASNAEPNAMTQVSVSTRRRISILLLLMMNRAATHKQHISQSPRADILI